MKPRRDCFLHMSSGRCRWLIVAVTSILTVVTQAHTSTNPTFASQDPWITYVNGAYYYSESYCGSASICIKASTTLTGLSGAAWVGVWSAPAIGPNSGDVWAPELHYVDGQWYIYYAADTGNNDTHRPGIRQLRWSRDGSFSIPNMPASLAT